MFEKVVALLIIVIFLGITIVPYLVGIVCGFQESIAVGVISVAIPIVGVIVGWSEICGYPMASTIDKMLK